MSTKQLLAEIERGIKALQKAQALCLKSEAVTPKAKVATKIVKAAKAVKAPIAVKTAKKAAKGGMSDEGRAKIAAAQQKRWAKVRREKNKAAKAALAVAK
jgi:hypothetical protein